MLWKPDAARVFVGTAHLQGTFRLTWGYFPENVFNSGFDTANTNTSFNQRPDQIRNPGVSHPGIQDWFNIDAFAVPCCPVSAPLCAHSTPIDVGRFADVKPGSLVGSNFVGFDMSLMRNFHVTNRANFQHRVRARRMLSIAQISIYPIGMSPRAPASPDA
ncbi:MAG: outer membrane beta-barrel protein [Acidobacteriaceae bacterium]